MNIILLLLLLLLTTTTAEAQTLTWQDNSDNEKGFKIERSKDNGPFAQIAIVPANTETYTEPNALPTGVHCYRVSAYNDTGSSTYSNIACTKPTLTATKTPSRYKFTVTGTPPDQSGGWTAIFFRNNVINLGSDKTAPYSLTVELSCGLIYDFWITWIKTGVNSVNSQHQIISCP